jgi:hypothetical protein
VKTVSNPTIGQLIDDQQFRDAIHVAIAPVVATENLQPGWHIGITSPGSNAAGRCKPHLGIVDPFLTTDVKPGQRFFMFLYPNTITSLRHEWTHPAMDAASTNDAVADSTKWIAEFAAKIDQTPHRLMEAAREFVEYGEYTYDNSEAYKDFWHEFPEFWKHYEIVTGKPVDDKEAAPFTCSC